MAGSSWICPRCGAATNVDVCPGCLHERPLAAGSANAPGSYLGTVQGRQGYAGLPRPFAIGCLLLLFAPLVGGVLAGLSQWLRR